VKIRCARIISVLQYAARHVLTFTLVIPNYSRAAFVYCIIYLAYPKQFLMPAEPHNAGIVFSIVTKCFSPLTQQLINRCT